MKPTCLNCTSIHEIRAHIHQVCGACKEQVIRIVTIWHRRTDAFLDITRSHLFGFDVETAVADGVEDAIGLFSSGQANVLILPPTTNQTVSNANPRPILDRQSGKFMLYTLKSQGLCATLFLWEVALLKRIPSAFG